MWQWAKGSREASGEGPTVRHTCFCSLSNTWFELVSWFRKYQFLFFTMQFFPPSLKIAIPKHNIKWKRIFYFNFREKLCFTDFSTRICWNRSLAASGLFFLFAQSNKFYKFHWHILRKRLFIKETEWRMVAPFSRFYAKFELVLVLTQENAFILKVTEKA